MLRNIFLRKFITDAAGFTILEVAVAMALLSLGMSLVGTGVFQVLHSEQFWEEDALATKDLRHIGSWFAGDVMSTETTDLVEDATAVSSVTLTSFTGDEITYSVSGQDLIRTQDDGSVVVQNIMASDVQSASFSLSSDVVTMTLVVFTDGTNTKSLSLDTKLRAVS